MNGKIKAFAIVALMVAVAFAVAIPAATSDNGADAATGWNNNHITVAGTYTNSTKIVLPLSEGVFKIVVESGVVATATGEKCTIDEVDYYKSGAVVTYTATASGIGDNGSKMTFTAYYTTVSGEEMSIIGSTAKSVDYIFNKYTGNLFATGYVGNTADNAKVIKTTVGAEFSFNAFKVNDIEYSATDLPAGLTMEKEGKIYGAIKEVVTDNVVTLIGYDADKKVYSTTVIKITSTAAPADVTYANLINSVTATDSSINNGNGIIATGDVIYVYSDSKLKYNFNTGYNSSNVEYVALASYPTLSTDKVVGTEGAGSITFDQISNVRGEFTVQLKVTTTVPSTDASVEETYTSLVDLKFYVVPVNEFLTAPEADAQISYA